MCVCVCVFWFISARKISLAIWLLSQKYKCHQDLISKCGSSIFQLLSKLPTLQKELLKKHRFVNWALIRRAWPLWPSFWQQVLLLPELMLFLGPHWSSMYGPYCSPLSSAQILVSWGCQLTLLCGSHNSPGHHEGHHRGRLSMLPHYSVELRSRLPWAVWTCLLSRLPCDGPHRLQSSVQWQMSRFARFLRVFIIQPDVESRTTDCQTENSSNDSENAYERVRGLRELSYITSKWRGLGNTRYLRTNSTRQAASWIRGFARCFMRVPQLFCSFPTAQASKGKSRNIVYKTSYSSRGQS